MVEPSDRSQEMAAEFWQHARLMKSTWAEKELALMFEEARDEGRREERERCAKIADQERVRLTNGGARNACRDIVAEIRDA